MRPGQAAPVFGNIVSDYVKHVNRFNEAGAGCPGIPS